MEPLQRVAVVNTFVGVLEVLQYRINAMMDLECVQPLCLAWSKHNARVYVIASHQISSSLKLSFWNMIEQKICDTDGGIKLAWMGMINIGLSAKGHL